MEKAKGAMALVDVCRSPVRRQIMILAEEAAQAGKIVTSKSLAEKLDRRLQATAFQVKILVKAGALKQVGGEQIRGALQKHYVPSEDFKATMADTVALDQIAELFENVGFGTDRAETELGRLIRATGRPVEG